MKKRTKEKHEKLIQKYYPNGCILDEDLKNPIFYNTPEEKLLAESKTKE